MSQALTQPETPELSAKRIAHETRLKAIVNTSHLLDVLTDRGMDSSATFAQVRDALDANMKISGMLVDKAQQAPQQALPSFVLKMSDGTTLVVGGGPEVRQCVTVDSTASKIEDYDLPPTPEFLNTPLVSNLASPEAPNE